MIAIRRANKTNLFFFRIELNHLTRPIYERVYIRARKHHNPISLNASFRYSTRHFELKVSEKHKTKKNENERERKYEKFIFNLHNFLHRFIFGGAKYVLVLEIKTFFWLKLVWAQIRRRTQLFPLTNSKCFAPDKFILGKKVREF